MQMRNESTAVLADQMIEAAQALERAARALKAEVRIIRRDGLVSGGSMDSMTVDERTALHRMHKTHDIKTAAAHALRGLGAMGPRGFLIETDL